MAQAILCYVMVVLIFALYFRVFYGKKKIRQFFSGYFSGLGVEISSFLFEKISGVLLMFVIPAIIFYVAYGEVFISSFPASSGSEIGIYILPLLILLTFVVNFINMRKPESYRDYPQIKSTEWNLSLLFLYLGSWFLYVFAYEYLFRELLFFSSLKSMPLVVNIILNSILYALAHIPKGWKEIIGSLPFGVILCLLAYEQDSFAPAVWLHFSLAASNSVFALIANPGIKFKWSLK